MNTIMTLPIILCDDDTLLLSHYKSVIENWIMINDYEMKLVLATTDPEDIFLFLKNNKFTNSLFFLDIDLGKQLDGIDVAQRIRNDNEFAEIVFITSHQELALETLKRQIAPLDYIIKDEKTEKRQIEKILDGRHTKTFIDRGPNERHLSFMIGSRNIRIDLSSIYFLETSVTPHKVILYGENMMYEFYGKMNDLEKEYPELMRVHKSYLINLKKVKSIDFKSRTILFPEEYTCTFPLAKAKLLRTSFS
ncbi:two-component system, LytTR family, response regulator AgrA [Enterococcus sp. DIV0756]